MKKVFIDSKDIKYFIIDAKGKITAVGGRIKSTWENTLIRLESIIEGEPLELTFNGEVYTKLAYNTTKIEEIE